jgi:hypothetical protein
MPLSSLVQSKQGRRKTEGLKIDGAPSLAGTSRGVGWWRHLIIVVHLMAEGASLGAPLAPAELSHPGAIAPPANIPGIATGVSLLRVRTSAQWIRH